ncbi:MAG TPA: PIN domain-containing protein [Myxococcales bacterium]|jgi:predicted nucleic acid-binding protein|nr:PIN domain-containing protein [Myxococcales bacterium]
MTPTALLCDTGALLDYLVATAPDHRVFRDAIDGARTRYIPGLVLAEVDYFLRKDRRAMGALIRDLSRGAFTYAPPSSSTLDRAMEIDRQYGDLRLGLVDASIVALAEEVFVHRLVTRDVRHFSSVRLRGGRRFDLVVQPRRPER